MTTRLFCRECGWSRSYRSRRGARRAAAHHDCATPPQTQTSASWWTRLRVGRRSGELVPDSVDATTDAVRTDRESIRAAVLAAYHAETARCARRAMVELVRAGYHVGPPPYGYRALRIRVIGETGHGRLRNVLVPDWHTAAVVVHIFALRVDARLGFAAIARRLNSEPRQYPTPSGTAWWSATAVRRIVTNPRYTGRQVWARTVAGRPVPVERWVVSKPRVHEPLVDDRVFQLAQPGSAAALPAGPSPDGTAGAA